MIMAHDIDDIDTGTIGSGHPASTKEEHGRIYLLVCKSFSGEIVRAEVSLGDTVEQALPAIADQIGYYSPDWEKIGLYNMTRDFEYTMDDRFIDSGTENGDLVFMADGTACHKE